MNVESVSGKPRTGVPLFGQRYVNGAEYMFLIAYAAYVTWLIISITVLGINDTVGNIFTYIRYGCYALVIIKICLDQFYDRQIVLLIIAAALVLLSVYASVDRSMIFTFLFLIGARNVEFRKIIRITMVAQAAIMAIIITLSQTGILLDFVTYADGRARHCLGFEWASTAPYLFLFFLLGYCFLRKERLRIYEVAVFEVINYVFFMVTNTRMAFAIGAVVPICFWLTKYFCQNRAERIRKNKWLLVMPSLFCIAAILMSYFYREDNAAWARLNSVLSDRLAYGKAAIDTYGISLFGTEVKWIGNGFSWTPVGTYNFVDSSYVKVLINHGLVILCLIIIVYTMILYRAVKEKNFYLQLAMLVIVVVCFTEPFIFEYAYNAFVFSVAGVFSVSMAGKQSVQLLWTPKRVHISATQVCLKERRRKAGPISGGKG